MTLRGGRLRQLGLRRIVTPAVVAPEESRAREIEKTVSGGAYIMPHEHEPESRFQRRRREDEELLVVLS